MRKLELNVPTEVMKEFTDELVTQDLSNTITGTTEDGEIVIEVEYERSEADQVDALEQFLTELCEGLETEDDE